MSVHAVVTRKGDDGTPEVVHIEFLEGVGGWRSWISSMEEHIQKVNVGGHWTQPEGFPNPLYDSDMEANTVAILLGDRPQVVGWRISDMNWEYLKFQAGKQNRELEVGRPRALVQQLQTWRKWAKKAGAVL